MALFTYKCEQHGNFQVALTKRALDQPCPTCSKSSRSIIVVGTSVVFERLDNGAMAKAVERMHDVEELIEERNAPFSSHDESEEPDPQDD
jgi:hypothetical protein